jgi:pimeloyl-ACP methyl ester carboxylesterase
MDAHGRIVRITRLTLLGLIGAGFIVAAATAGAAPGTAKPSVVLVHGAFEDGTAWQRVIAILQRDHYHVVAAQTPLTSLAADVQATRRIIEVQDGPVVLVGHSWGGAVITDAGALDARVKALVYVAAFAPDADEPVTAFNEKYPTRLDAALRQDTAGYLSVDPARFQELFAKDVDPSAARVAASTQKPILAGAFGDAPAHAAWKTVPAWDLITLNDQAIQPALQRFYAKRMKATILEVKSSHAVIASHAVEVAHFIEEAARSQDAPR